jgi:hypothetical protein
VLCTSSSSKYTEDASTCADIKNDFILKILGVFLNGSPICVGTDLILEHLFMNVEVRVAAEVIIMLLLIVLQVLC